MKKIGNLIIFILLFVLMVMCFGCRRSADFTVGVVITDIEDVGDKRCAYYTENVSGGGFLNKGVFCGTCGKFTVGDTVYLTKTK